MAKKNAPAAENNVDDLLAGGDAEAAPAAKPKAKKAVKVEGTDEVKPKAKAKPEAAAKPAKKASKPKVEPEAKPAAKPKAKAKGGKPRGERAESRVEDITAALLKVKKSTSYEDLAAKGGFDIRAVRRTARKLRDDGQIGLEKEGTKVYVTAA